MFMVSIAIAIASLAAWITHVVHCLQHEQWGFLIGGALFFPVAIIHGLGLWFGFFH
jgi:hypothetical protein